MTTVKITQGNTTTICEQIAVVTGNVLSPKSDVVPVTIMSAKSNSSWFAVVSTVGQSRTFKFATELEMHTLVQSQVAFFV